ncbi:hypothetical protein BDV41DRAFT_546507, partial [Aspergillus transmontanensis]
MQLWLVSGDDAASASALPDLVDGSRGCFWEMLLPFVSRWSVSLILTVLLVGGFLGRLKIFL